MRQSNFKIIITTLILLILAGAIVALIFVAPKTEITIYPGSDRSEFISQINIAEIQREITNQNLPFVVTYLQGIENIENVDINNYFNLFDKTAYFQNRVFIIIAE